MPQGLRVARLIDVDVVLTPLAAQFANFNSLVIVGDSDVIDTRERMRSYEDIDSIAADFGTTAPEYLAAALFFGQSPQPDQLYIGRWAQAASKGRIVGNALTTAQAALAQWTAISSGGFQIDIDGSGQSLIGLDFSGETNLNGVASVIDLQLAGASCTWDAVYSRFVIASDATGATSTVGYATAPVSGDDIGALLKLTAATAAYIVDGIAAETAVDCATVLDGLSTAFYGIMFATTYTMVDAEHVAVAGFIQASGNPHIYGVTITNTNVLSSVVDSDLASQMAALDYTRTFCQYSENANAVAAFFGRALTVNFEGNNTTLTMMYKVEPGVVAEDLTASEATALQNKRCNVYVNYNNQTAIMQYGVMSGSAYFDEIHGLDWLANRIQTDVYNLLYTSPTKIPQTDPGVHLITTTIEASCGQAVNNGLLAPGTWNSQGFGQIKQGDFLPKGFYVYAPPVSQQAQADREARKSPPIQVAAKLAGAIHTVDVLVNVNR